MYDGNPGEIDFGSSWREVRVSEGSSYRESTVLWIVFQATDLRFFVLATKTNQLTKKKNI